MEWKQHRYAESLSAAISQVPDPLNNAWVWPAFSEEETGEMAG